MRPPRGRRPRGPRPVRIPKFNVKGKPPKPFPIYVHFVMHNEDPPTNPNFTTNERLYLRARKALLEFAKLVHNYGAAFDWQSEWCFLAAVRKFDKPPVTNDTGGANIVYYINRHLGVSVDPHSHERFYNYADVAELIKMLDVEPSKVVGGFLYYPPSDPKVDWEKFKKPLRGNVFKKAVWTGRILWGAGTRGHRGPDLFASGVWRPKDKYHFITHDPNQPLIYVGSYKRGLQLLGGVPELISLGLQGKLKPDGFYTASIFVPQLLLVRNPGLLSWIETNVLQPMNQWEKQGLVRWATLPEIARIWQTAHHGRPTIYIPEDQRKLILSLFPP